jgi:hypothetical protein
VHGRPGTPFPRGRKENVRNKVNDWKTTVLEETVSNDRPSNDNAVRVALADMVWAHENAGHTSPLIVILARGRERNISGRENGCESSGQSTARRARRAIENVE